MTQPVFCNDALIEWTDLGEGVKRKIMTWDERIMIVKVAFEKGSIGTVHQHIHTQMTFIESGRFEVEIDGQKQLLSKGDVFRIPANALHGVVCMEAGVLIDAFSPIREDFLTS
ncbi:cupin domain-containing protein [Niabella soli]|uniref:Cupin n=1 Tax=Niabella soli DSM 19437 TaxID=929713 RepID=W0F0W5_9BACT|nr:cupin domain-containing protein [Niabella soli]AHF16665.1 cupin [Niabella soli DSM 19437]